MFEKFGEFDSVDELNMAAEGLKTEGDKESLIGLAEENGIEKEDAEDYLNGGLAHLATLTTAALGRLAVEEKNSDIPGGARKIIYDMARATMSDADSVKALVMRKGARVDDIWGAMKSLAEKNKSGSMGIACGTDEELRRMIIKALKEGADNAKK